MSVDVRATGRLNKLYVELLRENPDWAADERRPDMNHFMARLVFCFFAEDTDIFNGEGLFTQTIKQMSERDGGNLLMDTDMVAKVGADDTAVRLFIKRFVSSEELINGKQRYCLWIKDDEVGGDASTTDDALAQMIAKRHQRRRVARNYARRKQAATLAELDSWVI